MGRESEALDLLTEAAERIESGIVIAQIAAIQMDAGRYSEARQLYERYAELSPLMEDEVNKWLKARRADTAYFSGDLEAAKLHAGEVEDDFYTALQQSLLAPALPLATASRKLEFPSNAVGAPASRPLELVARFWNVPALPAPEEGVVFDGLPDVRERRWAEENGFRAVEFTINAETAYALVDRGIPFLFTMVDAGYAHAQIVIGFDRARHSLWMRDAGDRRTNEAPLKALLERYIAFGPRGLALVPAEKVELLDGISFIDASRYDQLHQVQRALSQYQRAEAFLLYEKMRDTDLDHRLTRSALIALARYDSNAAKLLPAVEGMLELFPDESTFLLSKINALRDLGRKDERLALMRAQTNRADGDPLFAQHFAQTILPDARFRVEGIRAEACDPQEALCGRGLLFPGEPTVGRERIPRSGRFVSLRCRAR